MRLIPSIFFALGLQAAVADDYTGWQSNGEGWVPVLIEDFNGDSLNTDVWGRIPYVNWSTSDWRKYQSTDPGLVEVGDGAMTLWARYGNYTTQNNPNTATATYACGGVYTLDTFSFQYGYVEVRAKFNHTWGCWPAIWLMPYGGPWPTTGEIDMMEHLNNDAKVYQTLHYGTNDSGSRGVQKNFGSVAALNEQWHTYGLLWREGQIQFLVDGNITATYVTNNAWPFDNANNRFYLIIDEQIGGNWVQTGAKNAGYTYNDGINKDALEKYGSAMMIDYVHVYSDAKYLTYVPDPELAPEPATATLSLLALAGLASHRRRK